MDWNILPTTSVYSTPSFERDETILYAAAMIVSVYMKIVRLIRNVGDRAYAMSHAAAAVCTHRLAAGRVDGYQG